MIDLPETAAAGLTVGTVLRGISPAPYYGDGKVKAAPNDMQARAAKMNGAQINPDEQAAEPSDHLRSRLNRLVELADRAHLLASEAESIEVKLFGPGPPSALGVEAPRAPAGRSEAPPLAERFGDVARGIDGALDRLHTALSRISRHVD